MSLSVIIPLYNKQAFIAQVVEGLAAQLAAGDEIIVVDDCSTDAGAQAVRDLDLPGVQLLQARVNGGPASARNLGAALAQGSHLLFFDADDVPQPDLLAALREAIANHPGEAVWTYGLAFEAHGESAQPGRTETAPKLQTTVLPEDAFVESSLLGKPLCTASSTCVSADVFRAAGGFQAGLRYCEDPELWARLSAQHRIVRIERMLATYRDVPASLSYGLRAQPGSVDPYVRTLLALATARGDVYRRLATSIVTRNAVFSIALGGSRRVLLNYIAQLRRAGVLRLPRATALSTLCILPRVLLRALLALRSVRTRRRAVAMRQFDRAAEPSTAARRLPREPRPETQPPASSPSAVLLFLVLGCLQTLLAYFAFQRSDDHAYFLDIANHGLAAVLTQDVANYDLKAKAAGLVYYVLTTPSRLLGGDELTHLLWLRLLTLMGFLWAHQWVCRVVAPGDHQRLAMRSQAAFMALCLLYPAQLAWTASLLRDGASCAMLFATLLAWADRRWIVAMVTAGATLALRPEFALLMAMLAVVLPMSGRIGRIRHRILTLGALCFAISTATFQIRAAASAFALFAFGDEGAAYPAIQGMLDLKGYLLVLIQAVLDPMSIASPGEGGVFFLAEVAFFVMLSVFALRRLNTAPPRAAALLMVTFTVMWLFAYFELFVSGFSRHRLGPMIILIAVMAVLSTARRRRPIKTKITASPARSASKIPTNILR